MSDSAGIGVSDQLDAYHQALEAPQQPVPSESLVGVLDPPYDA